MYDQVKGQIALTWALPSFHKPPANRYEGIPKVDTLVGIFRGLRGRDLRASPSAPVPNRCEDVRLRLIGRVQTGPHSCRRL